MRMELQFRRQKNKILNQIIKNESIKNYVLKKSRFENVKNCFSKSQEIRYFVENVNI